MLTLKALGLFVTQSPEGVAFWIPPLISIILISDGHIWYLCIGLQILTPCHLNLYQTHRITMATIYMDTCLCNGNGNGSIYSAHIHNAQRHFTL